MAPLKVGSCTLTYTAQTCEPLIDHSSWRQRRYVPLFESRAVVIFLSPKPHEETTQKINYELLSARSGDVRFRDMLVVVEVIEVLEKLLEDG